MCMKQCVCVCVHGVCVCMGCVCAHGVCVHACVHVCVCMCVYSCSQEAAKPSTRALPWRSSSFLAQGSFCL